MGSGRWDASAWNATRGDYTLEAAPTAHHIYTKTEIDPALDPKHIIVRESRDSDANPNSTPLIIGLDVTGSMYRVLDAIARTGLGILIDQIYTRRPIVDPHVMVMGIGDVEFDQAPLQVTQFEAENQPLVKQLESIWLESGGGGNQYESYSLAWYFAAYKTAIDSVAKRGKRGYLFTVGDERPTAILRPGDVDCFVEGTSPPANQLTNEALLSLTQTLYDVYHVIVEQGSHASMYPREVKESWAGVLGQNVIPLSDHTKLAEAVVSTIQVAEGANKDDVVKSWSGDTSLVVANAVQNVERSGPPALPGVGDLELNY